MEDAVRTADVLLLTTPSHAARQVLAAARPLLTGSELWVSASKGIEVGSDLRMSEVLGDVVSPRSSEECVVLSGPSFAAEILRHLPTAVTAASSVSRNARRVQELFQNEHLRIYTTTDVIGTELGGALKNVIALAAGISDGLELGSNARAALLTRGLAEIRRLARTMGGQEATLAGLAGVGDLFLTSTGDLSRNRRVGLAIGRGRRLSEILQEMSEVAEGVCTAQAAHELAGRHGVEMPIVNAVYSILFQDVQPMRALAALMAREPKPERWS